MDISSLQRLCLESVANNLDMWCRSTVNEDFYKYMYAVGPFNDLTSAMVQQLLEISCGKQVLKASYFPIIIHGNITQLNLSICRFMVTDRVLKLLQLRCKKLVYLNLAGCSRLSSKCLKEVLPNLAFLKSLDLSNCQSCTDHLLKEFVKRRFDFQELHLDSCHGVTDVGIQALLTQGCVSLRNLNVSSTSVTTNTLIYVLERLSQLKRLCFSNIESAVEAPIFLKQVPSFQLLYLDISNTHLPDSIIKIIFEHSPKLTELKINCHLLLNEDFMNNPLCLSHLTSLDMEGVTDIIHFENFAHFLKMKGHQLRCLNLSGMIDVQISILCLYCKELKDLVLQDCHNIDAILPTNSLVETIDRAEIPRLSDFCHLCLLNLNQSSLSASTLEVRQQLFTNLVVNHGQLQKLFLKSWSDIDDDVLINIFNSSTCESLCLLDLSDCKCITTTSVRTILENCKKLQFFDLSYCWNIGLTAVSEMKEYLRSMGNQMEIIWV